MGSLFGILYHLGVVQRLVRLLARGLARSMGMSGAESLAAVANVFVGMTEAPLIVRPYLERMTRSELFCVMTTGMATIAGSVLVAYAKMLGEAEYAGHLVTASLLSAPAGVLIAKVMVPETETPAHRRGGRRARRAEQRERDRRGRGGRARRAAPRRLRRRAADRVRRAGRDGERRRRRARRPRRRRGPHAPAHLRLRLRAARAADGHRARRRARRSARCSA